MGGRRGGGRGAGGEGWAAAVAWVEVRTGLEPQRTPALFGQPTPTPCVRLSSGRRSERCACCPESSRGADRPTTWGCMTPEPWHERPRSPRSARDQDRTAFLELLNTVAGAGWAASYSRAARCWQQLDGLCRAQQGAEGGGPKPSPQQAHTIGCSLPSRWTAKHGGVGLPSMRRVCATLRALRPGQSVHDTAHAPKVAVCRPCPGSAAGTGPTRLHQAGGRPAAAPQGGSGRSARGPRQP